MRIGNLFKGLKANVKAGADPLAPRASQGGDSHLRFRRQVIDL
jgi:hypothetical protein